MADIFIRLDNVLLLTIVYSDDLLISYSRTIIILSLTEEIAVLHVISLLSEGHSATGYWKPVIILCCIMQSYVRWTAIQIAHLSLYCVPMLTCWTNDALCSDDWFIEHDTKAWVRVPGHLPVTNTGSIRTLIPYNKAVLCYISIWSFPSTVSQLTIH
jgi:hypothetical protein